MSDKDLLEKLLQEQIKTNELLLRLVALGEARNAAAVLASELFQRWDLDGLPTSRSARSL